MNSIVCRNSQFIILVRCWTGRSLIRVVIGESLSPSLSAKVSLRCLRDHFVFFYLFFILRDYMFIEDFGCVKLFVLRFECLQLVNGNIIYPTIFLRISENLRRHSIITYLSGFRN